MDNLQIAYTSILTYIKNNDCSIATDYFNSIDVIFTENIYRSIYKASSPDRQRIISQLKQDIENMDASVIMPTSSPVVMIILSDALNHDSVARKAAHEFIHFLHRCEITKLMELPDLYSIESRHIWEPYYYWDEFTTKYKELIFHFDTLVKWKPDILLVNSNFHEYVNECKECRFDSALQYMRVWLFLLAEYCAYTELYQQEFESNIFSSLPEGIQRLLPGVMQIYNRSSAKMFLENSRQISNIFEELKGLH